MNDIESDTPKLKHNHDRYNDRNFDRSYDNQDKHFHNSMIFRFFTLLILLALFSIPVSMLEKHIDQQLNDKKIIAEELAREWGTEQVIIGPILSIPYVERISRIESQTDSNGLKSSVSKDIFSNKTLMLLPENLKINAQLKNKLLSKDQTQSHGYQAEIEFSGNFNLEALPEPSAFNSIEWDKAFVAIGLNNTSVEANSPLRWEGSSSALKPGTQLPSLLKQGFHANLEDVVNDNNSPQFRIQLSAKGHKNLKIAPFGQLTSASIKSDSSNIIVKGDIPASSKVTTKDSFEASWNTSNLVRNYPQQWLIEENSDTKIKPDFSSPLMGIELNDTVQTTDKEQLKIKSILNYLIPILGILFLSLLILEFKRNSHSKPKFLHYLVISLPVLLIPVMLMTLQSVTNFIQAYQIVAGTSLLLIVFYTMSALKSFGRGFYILLIMSTLYALIFVNLEIPEYTLYAFSTAGLFIIVILMMVSSTIQEDQ